MKNLIVLVVIFFAISSCNSDDTPIKGIDYLIFGHFYGMCQGEECVETYKITDDQIFEDTNDEYFATKFNFQELNHDIFDDLKDLKDAIPKQLLTDKTKTFGCPDCADGGGLLIQIAKDGIVYTWKIDQTKTNVPVYLHDFMDAVNAKIALIHAKGY